MSRAIILTVELERDLARYHVANREYHEALAHVSREHAPTAAELQEVLDASERLDVARSLLSMGVSSAAMYFTCDVDETTLSFVSAEN